MTSEKPTSDRSVIAEPRHDGNLIGRSVGPYHILGPLGEGGFGSVYLAEQTEPVRRRVALKLLKPGMDSRSVLARFDAERQALALMDHPGVAHIFDAGSTDRGLPYFVMEHVSGVPITQYCDLNRLGVPERLRLMIEVCHAVQHAHQKGVIHRDLKPSNILVTVLDDKPQPKVIDFGIAKALHQRLSEHTIFTEQGQMIGTPEYMSPEQARGSALDIDTRADIYSLGAVLYELLTGATPLDSKTLRTGGYAQIQRALEDLNPPLPSARVATRAGEVPADAGITRYLDPGALSRKLRGDLDWIVMKCLEKDRTRRYDTASALAADVERFLRDEPVSAGPPSVAYRTRKFVRRHRGGVAAAAALTLALILGAIGTTAGLLWALREQKLTAQHLQEATAARQESDAVTEFLAGMLASVDPEERGRDVTVRQILDDASASIPERFGAKPRVEARLRHTIGNSYMALGRLSEAEGHLAATVDLRVREQGPDHPDTLRAISNLASLRLAQGRYNDALALAQQAADGFTRTQGALSRDAVGVMNNIAQIYSNLGRHEEAAALQRRVVEDTRTLLGEDDPRTLGAMTNLGQNLLNLHRPQEAEPLLRQAAEGWRRTHGADHPGTLLAEHALGMFYLDTSRPAEAEAFFRRILEARTRTLGPEHPDTVTAMSNLANTIYKQGRLEEAAAVFERSWDLGKRVLGGDHPDVLTGVFTLVDVYRGLGWPERSRTPMAELVRVLTTIVERPATPPQSLNDCAWIMMTVEPADVRNDAGALKAAQRACDLERAAGGENLWMFLDTLALALHRAGQHVAAAAAQREAISLLPPHGEQYRAEMQERLAQFEAAGKPSGGP